MSNTKLVADLRRCFATLEAEYVKVVEQKMEMAGIMMAQRDLLNETADELARAKEEIKALKVEIESRKRTQEATDQALIAKIGDRNGLS